MSGNLAITVLMTARKKTCSMILETNNTAVDFSLGFEVVRQTLNCAQKIQPTIFWDFDNTS